MTDTKVTCIAVDQYGKSHCLGTRFPRKELMELEGVGNAAKMYVDTKDGSAHVGYVVGHKWFTLYKVQGRGI